MWHKLPFSCPKCKCHPRITQIQVNADGDILLDLVCPKCNQNLNLCFTQRMMQEFGRHEDSQYYIRLNKLPYKSLEEKLRDEAFLRSINILPDEPKKLGGDK